MNNQHGYFDILDWLECENAVEPRHFFMLLRKTYGIANLIYADVTIHPAGFQLHRLHHTLKPSVQQAFADLDPLLLTPLLRIAFSTLRPLDWSSFRQSNPASSTFFGLAESLGLPPQGISYPLVSRSGRSALLSINVAASPDEWQHYHRAYGRDIHALAALFHAALVDQEIRASGKVPRTPKLTAREREALTWAAAGKSYWEIATILGISERTVRFFMANARRKLDVVSNTQAVAEAVWRGLIRHS